MDKESLITQETFRIIMNSFANPLSFFKLEELDNFSILDRICFTILDNEVSFCVVGNKTQEKLIERICNMTKSRYTSIEDADYVIVDGKVDEDIMFNLKMGSLEEPENSATLIYNFDDFYSFSDLKIRAFGPGIKNEIITSLSGVSLKEIETIRKLNSNFPLGIDFIFSYKDGILSLLRSTKIEVL